LLLPTNNLCPIFYTKLWSGGVVGVLVQWGAKLQNGCQIGVFLQIFAYRRPPQRGKLMP